MAKSKVQQLGDIAKIEIGPSRYCFAVALKQPLFAFFDCVGSEVTVSEELLQRPILFKAWVEGSAVKSGRWPIIGTIVLGDRSELSDALFFKQDSITGRLTAHDTRTGEETPISLDEAEVLECAAVWSAEQIESRLRDKLSGFANKWWMSMRPKG